MTPDYWLSAGIVFALALAASVALTLVARRLAFRMGMVATPGGRRRHARPVAKFGGLPLWGAFTLAALVAQLLPVERADPNEAIRLTGLLLGGAFIFIAGALDDRFDLSAIPQFVAQFIAAGIAITFLIFIERFNNPLTGEMTAPWPHLVTIIISLFWLVLMMNTVNWLDGADGLAAGVNVIAALLLFIHTVREGQLSVSLLPLALMGAALGFLAFNWYPASIFMGGGAVYLGFTTGALSIIGGAKMATILLVMGLPLLDVAWQVARRLAVGKNPLIGDRGHLHFRLIDAGVSPRLLVAGYYVFCLAFGLVALSASSRMFKLIALVVLGGLAVIGFAVVARRGLKRGA
ncbi:MAG: undecaprenyl/decaprenyl-phosphate alpha-N-acetylglucosaminyl 1-phosphate transferase [Anaerolineae bacterium]|nr:undecaprenyl/decaprenyl-phosphate alpha-N-acetylglucosaminyl 1-phosphate transferase [Anaerolineae bacterium]